MLHTVENATIEISIMYINGVCLQLREITINPHHLRNYKISPREGDCNIMYWGFLTASLTIHSTNHTLSKGESLFCKVIRMRHKQKQLWREKKHKPKLWCGASPSFTFHQSCFGLHIMKRSSTQIKKTQDWNFKLQLSSWFRLRINIGLRFPHWLQHK